MNWEILSFVEFLLIIAMGFSLMKIVNHLRKEKFRRRSLSVKYGKSVEEFAPFMEKYKYNPSNFRFIGSPIDGVQFEDDKIIFMEFKSSSSKLSEKQKRIKELIKRGKVFFEEFRID